jgi:hypothetical protein
MTAGAYRPLPRFEPRAECETAEGYGLRALAFCLEHGPELLTVPDEALQLADHVYPAVLNPAMLPAAVDRLSAVRHRILATLSRRRQWATEPAAEASPAMPAAVGEANGAGTGAGPSGGAIVPRRPAGPVLGPSGGMALRVPRRPAMAEVEDPF